jgi:hypothetical protein
MERKGFLPTEIGALAEAAGPAEAAAAKTRMVAGTPAKVSQGSGRAVDKIGAFAGVSGRTVEKILKVVATARAESHRREEMARAGTIPKPPGGALADLLDRIDRGPAPGHNSGDVISPKRQGWAKGISKAWREGLDAIFKTGRLLVEAKADLPHGEFIAMIESKREVPFHRSTAFRLMAIVSDDKLTNDAHGQHLPPSWRTLYELTKLEDADFAARLADSSIRPDLEMELLHRALHEVVGPKRVVLTSALFPAMVRLGVATEARADFIMRAADGLLPLDAGHMHGGGWMIHEDIPGNMFCTPDREVLWCRGFNEARDGYEPPA